MSNGNVPIAKFPYEEKTLLVGEPLVHGQTKMWSSVLPAGRGAGETWERLRIILHCTTGTAVYTFPVAEGLYNYITNIRLETSDGETIVDAPGSALYWMNRINDRISPYHTPFAAANATYDAVLDVPLGFRFLRKPEDGFLDSGAYSALRLYITTGAVVPAASSPMGIPGATSTTVCTFDLSVIRTKAGMYNNVAVKPLFVPYIKYVGNRVPSNANQYFDIESANDLAIFGFVLGHGSVARAPFDFVVAATGLTAQTDAITSVSFGDNIIPALIDQKRLESFQHERRILMLDNWPISIPVVPNIPTAPLIGIYPHIFVKDGSIYGAYPTGNKSQIRLTYTGGGATTNEAALMIFGFRTKRRLF